MRVNFTPFPILETDRLRLRALELNDSIAIYDYHSNKSHFEYVDMPVYTDVEQAKEYINTRLSGIEENKWIIWGIELKESKELIGTISIWNFNEECGSGELGYGLFPKYRKQGYMKEALECVVDYGFEIIKLKTIEAYTNEMNMPSRVLLEDASFKYCKYVDEEGYSGKLIRMSVYYRNYEV